MNWHSTAFTTEFKLFHTLADAREHVKGRTNKFHNNTIHNLPLWAQDKDTMTGKKRYLCCGFKTFHNMYKLRKPEQKCFYEIIQNSPVKLFFDIDCDDTTVDIDGLVDELDKTVQTFLEDNFSCGTGFIVLDSSSSKKLSKHVVYEAVFQDIYHVERAVRSILEKLKTHCGMYKYVDTSVYNENRCFRVYGSSKRGKERFLVPDERFKLELTDEEFFYKSLVTCFLNTPDENYPGVTVCKSGPLSFGNPKRLKYGGVKTVYNGDFSCTIPESIKLDTEEKIKRYIQDCLKLNNKTVYTRWVGNIFQVQLPARSVKCIKRDDYHSSNTMYAKFIVDENLHDMKVLRTYYKCLDPECEFVTFGERDVYNEVFGIDTRNEILSSLKNL